MQAVAAALLQLRKIEEVGIMRTVTFHLLKLKLKKIEC